MGQYNNTEAPAPEAPAPENGATPGEGTPRKKRPRRKLEEYPDSARKVITHARSNTKKTIGQNLQLVALLLADVYPSHVGPLGGLLAQGFAKSNDEIAPEDVRKCLCVHLPTGKVVCWVITQREVDTYFPTIPKVPEGEDSHWDKATAVERTNRLNDYKAWLKHVSLEQGHAPAPTPVPTRKAKAKTKAKARKKHRAH